MRANTLIPSLLIWATLMVAAPALGASGLWEEVESLRNDEAYSDATAWRRAQVRAVVADIVRGASTGILPASAKRRAEAAGLVLRDQEAWVLLSSRPDQADGFFVVRKGADVTPLVLQAPHAWYDRETGRLACALFEQGVGRALMVNSAHRHAPSQGDSTGLGTSLGADVAHRPDSVFQAATLGVVDALNDPLVVQLHGFGSSHGSYAAVLSEGATFQPSAWLRAAVSTLEASLGRHGALVTGHEVPELAGRTNVQSQALTGQGRFMHVELSLPVRQALLGDNGLLERFGRALSDLAERVS